MIVGRGAAELGAEASPRSLDARRAARGRRRACARSDPRARSQTADAEAAQLTEAHVADAVAQAPARSTTASGDQHYDFASAFIKSMRGGDADAAVYYLAAMLEARRGSALHRRAGWSSSPPRTSATPIRTRSSSRSPRRRRVEHVGLPEAQLNLAQAAIYLARAPKSNASAVAIWEARRDVREHGNARAAGDAPLDRPQGGRASARALARATPTRTTTQPAFEVSYLPEELRGRPVLSAVRQRRGAGGWR